MGVPPPTRKLLGNIVAHAVDSAPGPDGLPYSAWKFGGETGIDVLYDVGLLLAKGMKIEVGTWQFWL